MGVSFTLRGLNTQLSLIRKAGYPVHVAQDICGSYYLNLDMSASLFDNIFWFKTTNPDLKDDVIESTDYYGGYTISLSNESNVTTTDIIMTPLVSYSLNKSKFKHYKIIIKDYIPYNTYQMASTGFFRFYTNLSANPDDNIFPSYAISSHTNYYNYADYAFRSNGNSSLMGRYGPGWFLYNLGNQDAVIHFSFGDPIEIKKMLFQPLAHSGHGLIIENMELYGTNDASGNYSSFTTANYDGIVTNQYIVPEDGSFYTNNNSITWTLVNNITNVSSVFTLSNIGSAYAQPIVPVHFDKLNDVAYYVDSNYWPDISYSHGLITNPDPGVAGARTDIDTFYVQPNLRFIGPAWLAKNITGGYNNSDLFENEDALQRQFVNFNGNFYKYVRFVFKSLVDASFGDYTEYTTDVSSVSGYKRGFVGIEDLKFYENNTQIQVSDISDITYSSGTLTDSSINSLFDDSSGTFWISSDVNNNNDLLYEASDPSINDASYIELGVYTRKYQGNESTPYTLQLKNKDNKYVFETISGEWLQFEFNKNVSFTKIDFRPVGDHTPTTNISFVGTIPRSIAILTSLDGTNWEVLNDYDNLNIPAGLNNTSNNLYTSSTYYKPLLFPNIKREITGVLDASGGSELQPLSNADTGFNNISRDILKNMLDSDDPDTVQRVHNQIIDYPVSLFLTALNNNTDDNIIDTSAVLTQTFISPLDHFQVHTIDLNDYVTSYDLTTIFNSTRSARNFHGRWYIGFNTNHNSRSADGVITDWDLRSNYDNFYFGQYEQSLSKGALYNISAENDPIYSSFTIKLQIINTTQYRISSTGSIEAQYDLDLPDTDGSSTINIYYAAYVGDSNHMIRILPNSGKLFECIEVDVPNSREQATKKIKSFTPPEWLPIEFQAGDKMEFSLTYGTSDITDSSNVALNSSGNRLGSNVVEDQDYYVRIHMK